MKKGINFLNPFEIDGKARVTDIVAKNYRTVSVFRKYDIDFCCGGNQPLEMACLAKGLDIQTVRQELEKAIQTIELTNTIDYSEWSIDFLADYIINVHHQYLKVILPEIKDLLQQFIEGHEKKYPNLQELGKCFLQLYKETLPHLLNEEDVIFPYVRQIAHAYESGESYASQLVRIMRKPVEEIMTKEHNRLANLILKIRELTDNYVPPAGACARHKVSYYKLKELDNDLVQHIHLENDVLFRKAIAMEKQLLQAEAKG
jgi:regulator of cell morphogenesis and NO signaling